VANTAAVVLAAPNRITYLLTGDGTVVGPTLASATVIGDCAPGALKEALEASYADQAAMRNAFNTGIPCKMGVTFQASGNTVTAEKNQIVVDVDVDAVTSTRPEFNIEMSDTTGQIAYLTIEYVPGAIR
jgi:hypothetical protein